MPSAGKINISLPILDVFQSRRFRKNFMSFLITHFQYRRVLSTYFIIYGKFDLFMKILNFNEHVVHDDVIKKSRDFDYSFGVF